MAEQVVRTHAGLLDTFFRACPFPIVVDDPDRVITLANPAFHDVFGYTPEECLGKRIEELVIPAGDETNFAAALQIVMSGDRWHFTTRQPGEGSTFHFTARLGLDRA